ncbi:hypothetical protein RJ639_017957 [Escallonia herrerae]|uniref:Protein prenyltransferase alpha subunit repeat-containing protein 1 n=1 Tax=Escallonia herrerae TaxID=1293975 RepID=A0AA88V9L8_9ASTE|nr:hypothetical protein RJ639_017957 [Escallonia herrerae]
MSDQDSNREAGPSDLLTQLEFILESDPLIDEVGFVHPSQFISLVEKADTPSPSFKTVPQSVDGVVESKASEVHPTDMVFWCRDHKLGISSDVLHELYIAAKHAFMAALDGYKRISSVSASKDGFGDEIMSSCCSSFLHHESEVMKHSRALLLLSSDFGTAWNSRKLVVHMKRHFPIFEDELFLSALVLSYAPKSERAWSHRRWVIKMVAGKFLNLQDIVEKESQLVERIAERSKMNYNAWNHRSWLISYMSGGQVLDEWKKCREWAGLHVADNSCFHYRTRLMLRMLEDSWYNDDSNACHNCNAGLYEMWKEELDWVERLIKRYRGREALWLYRRFLSVCWIKHFANRDVSCYFDDHQSSSIYGLDIFMDNELRLLRYCTTIPSFEFEDYQADAKFSSMYILWLTKHMPESHRIEFQKKLQPEELETLLNNVCPEKVFLWDYLRTQCEGLEVLY